MTPTEADTAMDQLARAPDPDRVTFVVTLAEPVITGDTAQEASQIWCGCICGAGSTHTLRRNPDEIWQAIGTTGSQWTS